MAKLTVIAVENIKPGPRRREIPDSGCRGLYLVVQPSGRKSWAVRYRFQGTPRKLTLDGALTLATARKAATDALHVLERGHDPAAAKKSAKVRAELAAANTLRAVAESYLVGEERKPADKRLRTIASRRATFERLIFPRIGGRPVADIRRSEIVKLLDHVEAERGGRMADEVLGVLRIVFDWYARRDDDFRTPIVKGLQRTRPIERMRNRVLSDDELARVWIAADGMAVFGLYVQFMLLTATRRNEAARMTHGEVLNGDWLIPASRYKNKLDHLVPLSKAAQALLAKVPRIVGCEYVFTTDGKRAIGGLSGLKAKLDKASGVTGYRLHDLRRSSRSQMSAAGVDPDHAERCLGHALPGIRKTYDRYEFRAEKLAAFEKLAARINQLANPPDGSNVVKTMAREPKTGVVQTPLGPLPEDFFESEGLPDDATPQAKHEGLPDDATPQAKLRAQLAQAHNIWRGAKDDQEGQNRRRYAYQVALRAVWEYVKNDAPSEHLYLLVRLAEHLDDLNLGRQPKELKPALRLRPKRGNRGLETHRATTLAEACAIVDVLSKDTRPGSKEKIEKEVAEAIGQQPGAFRSSRKAFNAGRKGPQAREAHGETLRMLQEQQPDPKQAARNLLKTHKRTLT